MIGGAALLADGMITPPISVTSAVEGLRNIEVLGYISDNTIVAIVLAIIACCFFCNSLVQHAIGKLFGPIMAVVVCDAWQYLASTHLMDDLDIFKAFNPYYAIELLTTYPKGFWILGAVFLCTTGAEALYSDLGHCGRENIRVSWVFVKTA